MLTRQVTLWCDELECLNFTQVDGNAAPARQQLRREGWGRSRGRDLCPDHARAAGIRPAAPLDIPSMTLAEIIAGGDRAWPGNQQ